MKLIIPKKGNTAPSLPFASSKKTASPIPSIKPDKWDTTPERNIGKMEQTLVKNYLQSFLKWVFVQNESVRDSIKRDEFFEYFLDGLNHPTWFIDYLDRKGFDGLVSVEAYLEKFGKNDMARNFQYSIPIHPASEGKYAYVKLETPRIEDWQKQELLKKGESASRLPDTKKEADYMLAQCEKNEEIGF